MSAVRLPQNSNGNGAGDRPVPLAPGGHSIGEHGRKIHHDVAVLAAEIGDTTNDVDRYLTDQVTRRPYGTLGAAAGIGFVLGGGLRTPLTRVLLGAASRVATALVVRELGSRILQSDPTPDESKNS